MSAILSGQKTISQANTVENLGSGIVNDSVLVRSISTNTDNIYIGNDGEDSVSITTGFILEPGDSVVFDCIGQLSLIKVLSPTQGQKLSWLIGKA